MKHRRPSQQRVSGRARSMGRRLLVEMMEERVLLSTITVNSNADTDARDAELTLREAILVANGTLSVGSLSPQEQAQVVGTVNSGTVDPDQIHFDIPGGGTQTIAVTSALPNVTDTVVIDGATQPGYVSSPLVRLLGTGAGAGVNGLTIVAPQSTVKGLAIVGFDGAGLALQGGDGTVQGNYLGIEPDGATILGNHQGGVVVTSANNTIGGTSAAERNVITGNGGIFQSAVSLTAVANPKSVGVGDFNGDGKNDLITLDNGGNIQLSLGNGDGTFQAPTLVAAMPGSTDLLVAGADFGTDINGDGNPDLVVADGTTGVISVLLGNGDGTFQPPTAAGTVTSPVGLAVIPSLSSGKGDIVVSSIGATNNVHVLPNDGAGGFGTPIVLSAGANPVAVTVARFGHDPITFDPYLAIVTANRDSNNVSVLERNADGTYKPAVNVAVGTTPVAIAAADLTKDGLDDVVTANAGSDDVTILIRTSAGQFTPRTISVGSSPSGVAVDDFDGDGQKDIATSNSGDGTVSVILRKPSGQLIPAVSYAVGGGPNSLTAGRFTEQFGGPAQLITMNVVNSDLSLLLNNTGSSDGVALVGAGASGNTVQGNYIGTDAAGNAAPGNVRDGVSIEGGSANIIGGANPGAGNVISGNARYGVSIDNASNNVVQGNLIGTNATGDAALGNFQAGVFIHVASSNQVLVNVISGNLQYGVRVQGEYNDTFDGIIDAPDNIIKGNIIGLNASGTAKLANAKWGISTNKATGTIIGGPLSTDRNVVSGNGDHGIDVRGATIVVGGNPIVVGSTGTIIQGNYVGTDITGTSALGNGGEGIYLDTAPGVTIGGDRTAGLGNLVSGNGDDGIALRHSGGGSIQGNLIGTDINGTSALGNGVDSTKVSAGIFVADSGEVQIGGASAGLGNLISGNIGRGILLSRPATQNVHVQGNFIGTDITGTLPLGNSLDGVTIHNSASGNTVGGTSAGMGNLIAFNGGAGINIEQGDEPGPAPTGNRLFENILYQNAGGAILSSLEATPTPVLTSVVSTGGTTHIDGTVTGPASTTVRVEFFDSTAGVPVFLGSADVVLDGSGQGVVNADFPIAIPAGNTVFATSTANGLNTSPYSAPIQVNSQAFDLSIAQTVAPTTGAIGQSLTYTVTVRNNFTDPVTGVVVTNILPLGATFVSSSITPATNAGGVLTFDLGGMAGEETRTFTVVVNPTLAGVNTNTVSVQATETDPDLSNNTATLTTTVNQVATADLQVTQSALPTPGTVGQDLTYTITVTNHGPNDATGVVLTNTLPADATFVSSDPAATTIISGVLTINIGNLASGASQTVTIVVRPTASGTLTNLAAVSGDQFDPDSSNNTNSLNTQVNTAVVVSDLAVSQSVTPTTGTVGETLTYIINVANNGPDAATGVVLTDTLSPGVVFVSSTPNVTVNSAGVLTFNLGGLASGASQTIILTVRPTLAGPITNALSVTSDSIDPNPANNVSNLTTQINAAPPSETADLGVTQSVLPIPGIIGQDLVYTIIVANHGPSAATGVTLHNTLPSGTTFVSASEPSQGAPGPNLTFILGDLAPGATHTVMIIVQPNQAGTVTNVATVTSPTPDNNPDNNTSTLTTNVVAPTNQKVDLVLTLTTMPSPAVAGQYVYYIFTVTNNGPGTATATQLNQTLPAGATFVATSGPAAVADGVVTADLGDLAPGASVSFAVAVLPTAAGTLTSQALVTTTAENTNPSQSAVNSTVVVNPATPVVAPTVTGLERIGVHNDPAHLVITFSEPLDPASAQDLNNYLVVDAGRDGRVGTRDDRVLPIAWAAYDPGTQTVTLVMRNLMKLWGAHYGLAINGGPGGLTGENGLLLDGNGDGNPGSDFVTVFGPEIWRGGTTTPVQPVRHQQPPIRHRAAPPVRRPAPLPRGPRALLARPPIAQRLIRPRAFRLG